ncbi:MAG: TrpR family transcriptional regulator, trp operon repressor [Parcubacteria group bacterium Greene0714_21]|nr:MAG: TrpR family transcriptional regulator, trp operon repressor [Parcubacteria group bacterium Greene0416_39]TSD04141.1 MAG: TrpR family transcriptional regulator, trp operon repressor [Parcubacteria group bacterium Greene0714_21]
MRIGERKQKDAYAWGLVRVLLKIAPDQKLLRAFLEDILTPTEYKEIPIRWQIVKQLACGIPQREIAKNLHVSIATITRGSRELLNKKGGFQQIIKKIGI